MNLIERFYESFKQFSDRRAFCIGGQDFSYAEFLSYIEGSRILLDDNTPHNKLPVGVLCFDTIETYAAIFAIWFSGRGFVPVNPKFPKERNTILLEKSGVQSVFSAMKSVDQIIDIERIDLLYNAGKQQMIDPRNPETDGDQLLYILTTSGSAGIPKYVPIHQPQVETYCTGFLQLFPELNQTACFLQTYDLTSDAAFTGYLLPLLVGACVYTLPNDQFKFLSISRLLMNKNVDWVKMTPSVLAYLNPYRSKLKLNHVRHVVFGGEPLSFSLLSPWIDVFPEAEIVNLYGPTETTISSMTYKCRDLKSARMAHDILSIGKPFPEVECLVLDRNQQVVNLGETGELCLAGKQTMAGYLNDENVSVFFIQDGPGGEKKFYKTGDLVKEDEDGFFYFVGRLDDQVKINGYRVNLVEVENAVRNQISDCKVVVVTHEKQEGLKRLVLFLENYLGDLNQIKQQLKKELPAQMIPDEVISVDQFPFTTSGKIDRKKLSQSYFS